MDIIEGNGARIPAIGLGTWELRGAEGTRVVGQALDLGYRHIDTAEMYNNEREVGDAIRASGVKRDDIFITTKVWSNHLSPPEVERAAKESVARLRVSHVDLLLIHWPNPQVPLAETIPALVKVKKAGLAKNIGVSNFPVALLDEAVRLAGDQLACNQFEFHPYLDQSKLIAACRKHGVAVVAYCPLARGRAVNDPTLTKIGKAYGKSASQVCLRWIVQQGIVAIPRSAKIERLESNAAIFDFTLTEQEMKEISALAKAAGRVVNFSGAPAWD